MNSGNVMCLELWGDQSGPYMQALHFSFGLGAFVAPLLAEPFLDHPIISEENDTQPIYGALVVPSSFDQLQSDEDSKLQVRLSETAIGLLTDLAVTQNDSSAGLNNGGENESDGTVTNASEISALDGASLLGVVDGGIAKKIEEPVLSKIYIVYTIIGIIVFLVALMFLCFVWAKPGREQRPPEALDTPEQVDGKVYMFILVGLLSLFFFLYVGMEVAYGQLVMTFSVHSDLNLSKSKGSYITAMFWGSFAAMRFVSIFLARVLNPTKMIILDFVLVSCGCIALSVGAATSEPALWIGSAFVGAGMASVFPSGFLWAEKNMTVTNKIASFFVVGAAAGEMVCPLVVGLIIKTFPMALMHQLTAANVSCILTFGAVWLLVNRRKGSGQGESAQCHVANQNDEDEMVELQISEPTSHLRASE